MSALFTPLTFAHGPAMKNRIMLAPLTNTQSHVDGRMSEEEFHWLTMRAEGGFGLTIKAHDSVAVVQLHHAGMRSPAELIGETPVCPSDNEEFKARALTGAEVEQLTEDFIAGAVRAQKAGFDGVEIHGAHGYVLAQFLSPDVNLRTDQWGGSPENRARIVVDILKGVRERCGPDFQLGLRLSPERFGLDLGEIRDLAQRLMTEGLIDYLDMSLWDVRKAPMDAAFAGQSLIEVFTGLDRGDVRLGVAGKVMSTADAEWCLEQGCDFVLIGRGAIIHHDWPKLAAADPAFRPIALPVTREHLHREGLSDRFVTYMQAWKGFVAEEMAEA
jgi:2,4-dienoyl-CoA reductase-like NADH-dependent reductase (Old Yellow Enzyme family)